MEKTDDKRTHKRYEVPEQTFAALNSDPVILGNIINISEGGLAFRYVANGLNIEGTFEIDIFLKNKGFYLGKLPFKTVSDFYMPNDVPFSTVKVKQCSGQFGDLLGNQASQLDYFIRKRTLREAH